MKKVVLFLSILFLVAACAGDKGNTNNSGGDGFDRTALLTNWADNIIIPTYQNYQSKVQELSAAGDAFVEAPTDVNLQAVRTSWIEAYKAYQYIAMYNFGKAQEIYFNQLTNTYPINTAAIESNIASGVYDLSVLTQYDKQGLPAMDYLLNGLASDDASILAFYTTNSNAANYKKYLTDVISRLQININTIVTNWNSGFRNSYIGDIGTAKTSSFNKTVNGFVQNIEKDVRTAKIGIPAGVYSPGLLYPEKVEAYYKNDISKELLNISVKASQEFFNGKHFNGQDLGPSLKSYLDYLNATTSGEKLSDVINNEYAAVNSANSALSNSLSQQVITGNSKMLASFDELQKLVITTKTEMMTAFKVTVDYIDSDGD